MNTTEQNPYDLLEPRHQLAIDLRLAGATYKQISKDIMISAKEHTIRTWFMNGGICKKAYEFKKKEHADDREEFFQKLHEHIDDIAISAVYTLHKAVESGNVQASLKILELADTKRLIQLKQTDIMSEDLHNLRQIIQYQRDLYKLQIENKV
jgi:hypothetical protein